MPDGTLNVLFNVDNTDEMRYIIGEDEFDGYGGLGLRVSTNGEVWCSINNGADGDGCSFSFPQGTISAGGWYSLTLTWSN